MLDPQHYVDTIDDPTLILVDQTYLASEFRRYHSFYSELYSGKLPNMPAKRLAAQLDASSLIDALCKYGHARRHKLTTFMFRQPSDPDIIADPAPHLIQVIDCGKPRWVEMGRITDLNPTAKRVILVADSEAYEPLLNMLSTGNYGVCLIKHKQEEEHDSSQMPPDIPYQFSYYVIGEAMGLSQDEL